MARSQKMTRRQALLLGLGTFASVNVLPILRNSSDFNSQVLALEATPQERDFTVVGSRGLKARAAAKKLLYGAAVSYPSLFEDKQLANLVTQECNMLIAEGDLLWSSIRPSPSDYDFTRADLLVNYAQTQKMLLGATHLVWHECLPSWFKETVNQQNAKELMLNHIKTVARRYAGKIHFWTVVNEAVEPSDGRSDGLRDTPWLRLLGPDYIDMAFRAAAEADPNAFLVYNDNRIEMNSAYQDLMRTNVLKLLERLKSKGTPVHALGMQTHLWYDTDFNPKILQTFLRNVADLGLKILITEMDVIDTALPGDIAVRDRKVAGLYEDILSVVLNEPAVIGANTWGLSDKYTWVSWFAPRSDGMPVRPLPCDSNMQRKLAWNGIARAFDKTQRRQNSSKLWATWRKIQTQT